MYTETLICAQIQSDHKLNQYNTSCFRLAQIQLNLMGPHIFRWYINYNDARTKHRRSVYRFSGSFGNLRCIEVTHSLPLFRAHAAYTVRYVLEKHFQSNWNIFMKLNVLWSETLKYFVVNWSVWKIIEDDFRCSCKTGGTNIKLILSFWIGRRTWMKYKLSWNAFPLHGKLKLIIS